MKKYNVSYDVDGNIYTTILKGESEEDIKSYCTAYLFGRVTKIELYRGSINVCVKKPV